MKLNVLSESNASTPATQSAIPPSPSPSPPEPRHNTGTQTEPSTGGATSPLRYVIIACLFLAIPFCAPLAITQGFRKLDQPQHLPSTLREIRSKRVSKRENDWSKWAVVRNGRLFISETFENRLNAHAGNVYTVIRDRFRDDCEGGDIGFALNRGDGIRGWMEVTLKCGYGTCVRKADVEDVRGLVVEVRDGLHYVTSGGKVWGPLKGRVRVGLDAHGRLGVRRVCDGVVEKVDVDVGQVREMVGDDVDVFRFDAAR